ncbi:MAG: hypothetical protein ACI9UK_001723, partial [Candidatus Krumholzibacteriia bacterium]
MGADFMEYSFSHTGHHFRCEMRGEADINQWPDFMERMLCHESWRPGTNWLKDLSHFDAAQLSVEDVQAIASLYSAHSKQIGDGKCAVVVSRDLEYGLARMW